MNGLGVIFVIMIVLAFIVFYPILLIWALNTIFPMLAIPVSLKTWFAISVLGSLFASAHVSKSK